MQKAAMQESITDATIKPSIEAKNIFKKSFIFVSLSFVCYLSLVFLSNVWGALPPAKIRVTQSNLREISQVHTHFLLQIYVLCVS